MAEFVVAFRLSPSEYWNLTSREREAIVSAQKKLRSH